MASDERSQQVKSDANGTMTKSFRLAAIGVLLQGAALTAFILISRTRFAVPGKQIVIGLSICAMLILIWDAVQCFSYKRLMVFCAVLAVGYMLAWDVLGAWAFPGLLKDIQLFSWEHLRAVTSAGLILFVLYVLAAIALSALKTQLNGHRIRSK